jgi:hypothetical protein
MQPHLVDSAVVTYNKYQPKDPTTVSSYSAANCVAVMLSSCYTTSASAESGPYQAPLVAHLMWSRLEKPTLQRFVTVSASTRAVVSIEVQSAIGTGQ